MNRAEAVKFAKESGLAVTKEVRTVYDAEENELGMGQGHAGNHAEFMVGTLRVFHTGRGGSACWEVEGQTVVGYQEKVYPWMGSVDDAIAKAVRSQL